MNKGVMSPWAAAPKETAQDKAEQIIENSPEGAPRREISFDGRAFQIVVAFFSFDRDSKRLNSYAHDALGRAIASALKADPAMLQELKRQSIFLDESHLLAPKVTVRLGPITLYVKASSFDSKMAQIMSMDRIALALADASGISAKVRRTLEDHDVLIARKA